MRRLVIVALLLNATLLLAIWQQLSVAAESGSGAGVDPCDADPTKYSLDTNADGGVDLGDFIFAIDWFFRGAAKPRICLATNDLEARIAALENQPPVTWNDIQNRPAGLDDGDDVGLTAVVWNDVQNRPAGLDDGDDGLTAVTWNDVQNRPLGLDNGDDVGLTVVSWNDVQNRPLGLDNGDDVGLTAITWSDIQNRPAGLDNGDDVGLTAITWSDVQNRPAGLDNGDDVGLTAITWSDVQNRPLGLDDGDDVGLTAVVWNDVQNRPLGLDDGDDVGLTSVVWNDVQSRPLGLDDGDDVGLTVLDWNALTNMPAAFADGLDSDGGPPTVVGFTLLGLNAQGYPEYTQDISGIRFVRLPGGSFDMGSPESELGRETDEGPVHTVSLTSFLIAKHEVTQAEYASVMTGNLAELEVTPSAFTGVNLPVDSVSWNDLQLADGFLERTGLSLPTAAQWEYAARAGTPGPYAGTGILDDMGWFSVNSGVVTHEVGTKLANQFGLYDLHGNVHEWCEDVYKETFYDDDIPGFNPLSTTGSGFQEARGGSFSTEAPLCRSGSREGTIPEARVNSLGFRPVMTLP